MLTLPLEPTDDRAKPEFKDASSCQQWLGQLQLTNLQRAHSLLLTQLDELNRFPIKGSDRLAILEALRETISFVQDDYAKKLIGKPLPLNDNELVIFVGIAQMWQAMVTGYQRCLKALLDGETALKKYEMLLCHRCLLYCGRQIFEHLRTGYDFDPRLWQQLHALYAHAEQQGFAQTLIEDSLNKIASKNSCRQIYVHALLSCYARPAELSRSQLQCLDRWLAQWSAEISIDSSYTASKGDAMPLALDLNSHKGLQALRLAKQMDSTRYLPMVPLSKLLRVKVILLQQGKTPQELELGTVITAPGCIAFLNFLHQCWCEDVNIRASERKPVVQNAFLCSNVENIYAHLAAKAFEQPELDAPPDDDVGEDSILELIAFEYPVENWSFENESLVGARLLRADEFGDRLGFRQLIAIRPGDAKRFILGVTAWVNVKNTGHLQLGMRYFPGVAEAVAIRSSDSGNQKFVPGFLLPEVSVLKSEASLIVPRDWFRENQQIDLVRANKQLEKYRMTERIDRGIDYDRVHLVKVADSAVMDW